LRIALTRLLLRVALTQLLFAYRLDKTYIPSIQIRSGAPLVHSVLLPPVFLIQVRVVFTASSSDGEGAVGLGGGLAMLINYSQPARENVMNAHGEFRLFLVVVNQPKIL
jgi:hypothetical protein